MEGSVAAAATEGVRLGLSLSCKKEEQQTIGRGQGGRLDEKMCCVVIFERVHGQEK